jgi:hypothetical protein
MTLIFLGVVVAAVVLGLLGRWWITRTFVDPYDAVSQQWRDEHSRERRDE